LIDEEGKYLLLWNTLRSAWEQASSGKGKKRHGFGGEDFEHQPICEIGRRVGLGYNLGQAVKKIYETEALDRDGKVAELLGAINYLASAIILIEEKPVEVESPLVGVLGEK
jgi:hypothetical protein